MYLQSFTKVVYWTEIWSIYYICFIFDDTAIFSTAREVVWQICSFCLEYLQVQERWLIAGCFFVCLFFVCLLRMNTLLGCSNYWSPSKGIPFWSASSDSKIYRFLSPSQEWKYIPYCLCNILGVCIFFGQGSN